MSTVQFVAAIACAFAAFGYTVRALYGTGPTWMWVIFSLLWLAAAALFTDSGRTWKRIERQEKR